MTKQLFYCSLVSVLLAGTVWDSSASSYQRASKGLFQWRCCGLYVMEFSSELPRMSNSSDKLNPGVCRGGHCHNRISQPWCCVLPSGSGLSASPCSHVLLRLLPGPLRAPLSVTRLRVLACSPERGGGAPHATATAPLTCMLHVPVNACNACLLWYVIFHRKFSLKCLKNSLNIFF